MTLLENATGTFGARQISRVSLWVDPDRVSGAKMQTFSNQHRPVRATSHRHDDFILAEVG